MNIINPQELMFVKGVFLNSLRDACPPQTMQKLMEFSTSLPNNLSLAEFEGRILKFIETGLASKQPHLEENPAYDGLVKKLKKFYQELHPEGLVYLLMPVAFIMPICYYEILNFIIKNAKNKKYDIVLILSILNHVTGKMWQKAEPEKSSFTDATIQMIKDLAQKSELDKDLQQKIHIHLLTLKEMGDIPGDFPVLNKKNALRHFGSDKFCGLEGPKTLVTITCQLLNSISTVTLPAIQSLHQELKQFLTQLKKMVPKVEKSKGKRGSSAQAASAQIMHSKLKLIDSAQQTLQYYFSLRLTDIQTRCQAVEETGNLSAFISNLLSELQIFGTAIAKRTYCLQSHLWKFDLLSSSLTVIERNDLLAQLQLAEEVQATTEACYVLAVACHQRAGVYVNLCRTNTNELLQEHSRQFVMDFGSVINMLSEIYLSHTAAEKEGRIAKLKAHIANNFDNHLNEPWRLEFSLLTKACVGVLETAAQRVQTYQKELSLFIPNIEAKFLHSNPMHLIIANLKLAWKNWEQKPSVTIPQLLVTLATILYYQMSHPKITILTFKNRLSCSLAKNAKNTQVSKYLKSLELANQRSNNSEEESSYFQILENWQNDSNASSLLAEKAEMVTRFTRALLLSFQEFFHVLHAAIEPEPDDDQQAWLDELDREEGLNTTGSNSQKEEETKEGEANCQVDTAPLQSPLPSTPTAVSIDLPNELPKTAHEILAIFRKVISPFCELPNSGMITAVSQKKPLEPAKMALRQHLFALDCLQTSLSLRARCQTAAEKNLQTAIFFLWSHQALEQSLTAKILKCPAQLSTQLPHELTALMQRTGLATNNVWAKENDCATKYMRYPFSYFNPDRAGSLPLALQHMINPRTASPDDTAIRLDQQLHRWLTELMNLIASVIAHDRKEGEMPPQLFEVIHVLSAKIMASESIQETIPPNVHLSKALGSLIAKKTKEIASAQEALSKMLPEAAWTWDPLFKRKKQMMQNALHHLNYLGILLPLVTHTANQCYLFLHVLMAQFLTHSLAENIGRYLSLLEHDEMQTHSLQAFCNCYGLDHGLSENQVRLLHDIDIKKGNEYFCKKFPKPEAKAQYARMTWINGLYMQSMAEDNFTPSGQKPINLLNAQTAVVNDLVALADLAITLVNVHFVEPTQL